MIRIRKISGKSMLPYLKPGDIAIFRKRSLYNLGDVVLISHNNLDKVKRITNFNKDKYFVVGDNLQSSTDSRTFGPINKSDIIGKIIWPLNNKKEYHERLSNIKT